MDTLLPIAPQPIITPPAPQPAGSNPVGFKWPLIAIFSFILGVAAVLAYQRYLPTRSVLVGASPSPAAVLPSPSVDPTKGWKMYSNDLLGISFSYPSNYKIEERVPGFLLISNPGENVAQAGISIETRVDSPYDNFTNAQQYMTKSFNLSETKRINQWEVFQGKGKEGMLVGVEFRLAIAPYKAGAIEMETLASGEYVNFFDLILSTFKFSN